jgi:sulfonate transport system substrate-binding protein
VTTTRRQAAALLLALGAGLANGAAAQNAAPKELRIGYQKVGVLVVARQQRSIETRLASQGITVRWIEFQAGPPLLEALNAGSIDFGYTGDAPPIFSQAAGGNLVYVAAAAPAGDSEALLVKAASPIRTVADLKGRTVAVGRGTSAHNLLVAALEKAGLSMADIKAAYLLPSDAGSAFANDSVEAWVIWDA